MPKLQRLCLCWWSSFVLVVVMEQQWDGLLELCHQCTKPTAMMARFGLFQPHHAFPTSHVLNFGDPLMVPTFFFFLYSYFL